MTFVDFSLVLIRFERRRKIRSRGQFGAAEKRDRICENMILKKAVNKIKLMSCVCFRCKKRELLIWHWF